jgi:hypothetical protein
METNASDLRRSVNDKNFSLTAMRKENKPRKTGIRVDYTDIHAEETTMIVSGMARSAGFILRAAGNRALTVNLTAVYDGCEIITAKPIEVRVELGAFAARKMSVNVVRTRLTGSRIHRTGMRIYPAGCAGMLTVMNIAPAPLHNELHAQNGRPTCTNIRLTDAGIAKTMKKMKQNGRNVALQGTGMEQPVLN